MQRAIVNGNKLLLLLSSCTLFFFQAEDGIRDCLLSRGLGDVYKRQSFFYKKVISNAILDHLEA